MGKKYFDTKAETLESSILGVWAEAAKKVAETNKNDKSDDGDGMDAVQPKAVKKKFKDRKDKDIDNDGDTDDSDEYLHNRRKTVSKAVKNKVKDEGNAFGMALKAAKEKGDKTFVVAGKTYEVKEEVDLDEAMPPMSDDELSGMYHNVIKWMERGMSQKGALKKLAKEMGVTRKETAAVKKKLDNAGFKEAKESYEIGTDEYRMHTQGITPGQEITDYQRF